jgi:hypothetical protein
MDNAENLHFDCDFPIPIEVLDLMVNSNNSEEHKKEAERFVCISSEDRDLMLDKAIPKSTKNKEKWAMGIFRKWNEFRNVTILDGRRQGLMMIKDIAEWNANEWNFVLKEFILEVRKEDGTLYNASSIKDIYGMLHYYIAHTLKQTISLWKDVDFVESRNSLSLAMMEATSSGKVAGINASAPISDDTESMFWENGSLGMDHPKNLSYVLVYLLGKHFALRGGVELHEVTYGRELEI